MKLEDWMKDQELGRWGDYEDSGLHVIGTCGDCKDFIPENVDSNQHPCKRRIDDAGEDFGCIYFKRRDV